MESQSKFWLPWNKLSSEIFYDQRIIISMPIKTPVVYKISKVENTIPKGVNMFTVYQDEFDPIHDYVNLETGEMYADYYTKNGNNDPIKQTIINENNDNSEGTVDIAGDIMTLTATLAQIKVGGGYKTITAKCNDSDGNDISMNYLADDFKWNYYIDKEDVSELIIEKQDANKMKIKFNDLADESYLGKLLTVECTCKTLTDTIQLEIIAL